MSRVVINLLGRHRPNDRDIISHFPDKRKLGGNLLPRFSLLDKIPLWPKTLQGLALQLRDWLSFSNRFRHGLSVHLSKSRLVIERLEMGWPARHAKKYNPLGLGVPRHLYVVRNTLGKKLTLKRKRSNPYRSLIQKGSSVCRINHGV
jgi:hypothetical protein